jgi:hypothetical protein
VPIILVGCSLLACLLAWWFIGGFGVRSANKQAIPIIDLHELTNGSSASIEGVVTFVNPEATKFFLQDGTAALALPLPDQSPVRVGNRVAVSGSITRSGRVVRASNDVLFDNMSVDVLGRAKLASRNLAFPLLPNDSARKCDAR